jgi:hypothetical protein
VVIVSPGGWPGGVLSPLPLRLPPSVAQALAGFTVLYQALNGPGSRRRLITFPRLGHVRLAYHYDATVPSKALDLSVSPSQAAALMLFNNRPEEAIPLSVSERAFGSGCEKDYLIFAARHIKPGAASRTLA